jgi:hypothetical protein
MVIFTGYPRDDSQNILDLVLVNSVSSARVTGAFSGVSDCRDFGTKPDLSVINTMLDQQYADTEPHELREPPVYAEGSKHKPIRRITWENYDQAQYFVGRIGPAKFEINSGVGGMFAAIFSFAGDAYAVLSTAKTVGEAKRFCEWIARSYGFDVSS